MNDGEGFATVVGGEGGRGGAGGDVGRSVGAGRGRRRRRRVAGPVGLEARCLDWRCSAGPLGPGWDGRGLVGPAGLAGLAPSRSAVGCEDVLRCRRFGGVPEVDLLAFGVAPAVFTETAPCRVTIPARSARVSLNQTKPW